MKKKFALKKEIENVIIGHNGFIGSELKKFIPKPKCYNSSNIDKLKANNIKNLFIAAPSAIKFIALKDIQKDLESVKKLIMNINNTNIKKIYLFATIDAVNFENDFNENSNNDLIFCNSYGIFRGLLEEFCFKNFDTTIIRLPIIFNKNTKKNFLYDLKYKKYDFLPNPESKLQFYNIDNLKKDLEIIKKKRIKKINLVSEPIKVKIIYQKYLTKKIKFNDKKIIFHNLTSIYAKHWNKKKFLYKKQDILNDIKNFIQNN